MDATFFYIALGSYFIGSIPFAFILANVFSKKDVRMEGSGNVGAMNAYEVTGSKFLGVAAMILDGAKGALSVVIAAQFFGDDIFVKQAAAFFATLGHCYPVWLKFQGGRGLATAAGAIMLFIPSLLISWCAVWVLAWFYSKKISFCNISATISVMLIVPLFESIRFFVFIILLASLILLRHRNVMKEAFKGG